MNGNKTNAKPMTPLGVALILALAVAGCASPGSKPSVRVVEEKGFIPLSHVTDTTSQMNLQKGDMIAMACSKCKTVLVSTVGQPRGRFFVPLEHQHYCPGCKSTITTTRTGLSSKQEIKHSCNACGDDSVFCCATQKGADATQDMEK